MTSMEDEQKMTVEGTYSTGKEDSYLQYLLNTNMSRHEHIPCKRTIVKVEIDDLATEVLHILMTEGFQSAPVMEGRRCVGFIDMLTLVNYLVNSNHLGATTGTPSWAKLWQTRRELRSSKVRDVMGLKYYAATLMAPDVVYEYQSTFAAMEVMADSGAHRLAVYNNRVDRKLVGILTQSMVISELRQRQHLVSTLLNRKVSDCTSFWKTVTTIQDTDNAINAFKKMANKHVTGLAIVNEDGVMEDTISATDLKGIGAQGEHFDNLFHNVRVFKEETRKIIPQVAPRAHYSGKATPIGPIAVSPDDTLTDVLDKMDDGNIHRVWVCSKQSINDGRPIPENVITQTDMIKIIIEHYKTSGSAAWF